MRPTQINPPRGQLRVEDCKGPSSCCALCDTKDSMCQAFTWDLESSFSFRSAFPSFFYYFSIILPIFALLFFHFIIAMLSIAKLLNCCGTAQHCSTLKHVVRLWACISYEPVFQHGCEQVVAALQSLRYGTTIMKTCAISLQKPPYHIRHLKSWLLCLWISLMK